MKSVMRRVVVGVALASGLCASVLYAAESGPKALPTLLIKGEVVSVNTTDPSATLLTVKDRYGFETPIYLTQEAKVSQSDQPFNVANLTVGTGVEVEYNFDINTAKRHAVSVKVEKPKPAATQAAATPAPATAPAAPGPAVEAAEPAASAPAISEAAPAPAEEEDMAPEDATPASTP